MPGAQGGRKEAEGQSRQGPVGHGEEFSFYPESGGNLLMGLPSGDSQSLGRRRGGLSREGKAAMEENRAEKLGGAVSKC